MTTGGSPQTAPVGTAFASPLSLKVMRSGRPVPGVRVRFAVPMAGASAVLSADSVLTDAQGMAEVTATASAVPGRYNVTASVRGASRRAVFPLENVKQDALGATFTQELQQNSLVAGKTSALRLFVGPDTLSNMSTVQAEVSRPDGSYDSATWSSSEVATLASGSAQPSIVVRAPGRLIPSAGHYRVTARILDAHGVLLANYTIDDINVLPTRDLRILVVFIVHPGYFDATQAWYDDIRESMVRIGSIFPVRDGVREGFDEPQSAGVEYVIGTPCDGWSTTYYDCVYGQTRQLNAQPGRDVDVTVEYRPGLYAPEYDPPGDPYPGGNAGPPPAPYSDLHRANCVAGIWNGTHVTAPACAHEIGHNFGFEASCSPHWDGVIHSKDYAVDDPFAFDVLKNAPYPAVVGDIMAGGWDQGADGATLNAFDWEYMRKAMLGLPGC